MIVRKVGHHDKLQEMEEINVAPSLICCHFIHHYSWPYITSLALRLNPFNFTIPSLLAASNTLHNPYANTFPVNPSAVFANSMTPHSCPHPFCVFRLLLIEPAKWKKGARWICLACAGKLHEDWWPCGHVSHLPHFCLHFAQHAHRWKCMQLA